jgi:hypothetical protein
VETSPAVLQTQVAVREAYREYLPPFDVKATVEKLISSVPAKFLSGLNCVVLVNQSGLSRRDRVGKVRSRKRKFDKLRVLGRYHPGWRNSSPYIELRVDRILSGLETTAALKIKLFREIAVGHVLFHELGHHIHATMRPEHLEKEDVADRWAGKLNRNFVRTRYWYLLPAILPALWVYRFARRREWI